jgi:hypothetical protein
MDAPFPDGAWRGFYLYSSIDPERHWMDLDLTFREGNISGLGSDDVGAFVIRGRYDPERLEAHWTKTYVGRHSVYYTGFGEASAIWGTWELGEGWTGGFKIWPRALSGELERRVEQGVEAVAPAS